MFAEKIFQVTGTSAGGQSANIQACVPITIIIARHVY